MTQAGLLEHLKLENVSLSHQLTETQHRSIKEKERIAVQLQGIEVRAVPLLGLLRPHVFWGGLGLFLTLVKVEKLCKYVYMNINILLRHTYVCL